MRRMRYPIRHADSVCLQPLQSPADVGDVALQPTEARIHSAQQGEDEVVGGLAHGAKNREGLVVEQLQRSQNARATPASSG